MKEFTTAVEDVVAEDEREAKIVALAAKKVEEGKSPEEARAEAESEVDEGDFIEFKLDDRVMRAYMPTDGQLAFMLAALGRGQTQEQRFAAIINIMMESLRDADQDYLESRLLTRNVKQRLSMKTIEGIFEHLIEEWFARPTQ